MTIGDWFDTSKTSVSDSTNGLWNHVGDVIGAVVILIVGLIVAWAVRMLVAWVLQRLQVGRLVRQAGLQNAVDTRYNWTELVADLAQWFVIIIFLIPALAVLGLSSDGLVGRFLAYIPVALLASVVIFVGFAFADLMSRVFGAFAEWLGAGSAMVIGAVVRYAVWVFTGVIALQTLGIDQKWIDDLILAAIVATAIGGGVAFGLGGREAAAGSLKRWGGLWPKR